MNRSIRKDKAEPYQSKLGNESVTNIVKHVEKHATLDNLMNLLDLAKSNRADNHLALAKRTRQSPAAWCVHHKQNSS